MMRARSSAYAGDVVLAILKLVVADAAGTIARRGDQPPGRSIRRRARQAGHPDGGRRDRLAHRSAADAVLRPQTERRETLREEQIAPGCRGGQRDAEAVARLPAKRQNRGLSRRGRETSKKIESRLALSGGPAHEGDVERMDGVRGVRQGATRPCGHRRRPRDVKAAAHARPRGLADVDPAPTRLPSDVGTLRLRRASTPVEARRRPGHSNLVRILFFVAGRCVPRRSRAWSSLAADSTRAGSKATATTRALCPAPRPRRRREAPSTSTRRPHAATTRAI